MVQVCGLKMCAVCAFKVVEVRMKVSLSMNAYRLQMGLLRDGDHVPREGGGGHSQGQRHGPHQGMTYSSHSLTRSYHLLVTCY